MDRPLDIKNWHKETNTGAEKTGAVGVAEDESSVAR
jgi:hypothetical protein